MELTSTEENYLKAILKLSISPDMTVNTNAIASVLGTSAASVTDMLKKLAVKKLVTHTRYRGAWLTEEGNKNATRIIRKNRLWKVFLVQSLGISWDQINEIAEELEHIQSDLLLDQLDSFLDFPKFDPLGDPIPNPQGKYTLRTQVPMTDLEAGQTGLIIGIKESDNSLLQYLHQKGIIPGKTFKVITHDPYDHSMILDVDGHETNISGKIARNILIRSL